MTTARVLETPLDRVTPPQAATKGQGPLIAIDLGTSNIRIAAMLNSRPTVLSAPRQRTPPSCIALGPRGNVVVGAAAEQQAASNPELAVFGVKRLTEGTFHSPAIRALRERQSCPFFEGAGGQTGVQLGDRKFSPRELVAILLADARNRAQELLGQPVYRAAIATPTGSDNSYRDLVASAATMAGLHLATAIPEPVAAATIGPVRKGKTVAVFDWGGGAFRFALLRYPTMQPELLAFSSDPLLGGIELDPLVLGYLLSKLDDDHPVRQDANAGRNPRLLAAAERLKSDLSTQEAARAHVPFIYGFGADAADFSADLARDELESILEPFVRRALAWCQEELDRVGVLPSGLQEVIVCGEQACPPLVQQRVKAFFAGSPVRTAGGAEAVVLGACAAAAIAR